jgi:hypothetical protein
MNPRKTIPHRFDGLAIKAPAKRKKPTKRSKTPEAAIQAQVEAYLRLVNLAWFHMPDALLKAGFAQGTASNFALINAAAEVRGLPDLLIFDPARFGVFLPVELKTESGKLSANQRAWQVTIGTRVCRGFEAARAEIDRWMADPIVFWKAGA